MKKINPLETLMSNKIKREEKVIEKKFIRKFVEIELELFEKIERLSYWNKTTKKRILNDLIKLSISKIEKQKIIEKIPSKKMYNLEI